MLIVCSIMTLRCRRDFFPRFYFARLYFVWGSRCFFVMFCSCQPISVFFLQNVMDSDDEQSDSGSGGGPLIGASDSDHSAPPAKRSEDEANSDSDSAPRKKKKQIRSSDESD